MAGGGGGGVCMGDYEGRERTRHRNMKSVASLIGKRKDKESQDNSTLQQTSANYTLKTI